VWVVGVANLIVPGPEAPQLVMDCTLRVFTPPKARRETDPQHMASYGRSPHIVPVQLADELGHH